MKKKIFFTALAIFVGTIFVTTVNAQIDCKPVKNQDLPECNCVKYARSQVDKLPFGLDTLSSKKATMNHAFPTVGSVAVHDIFGTIGHVSVVRNVVVNKTDGSLTVTVQEGNYESGKITTRVVKNLSEIVGYFDPRFSKADTFQKLNSLSLTAVLV